MTTATNAESNAKSNANSSLFSEAQVAALVEQHYQLHGKFKSLPGYCDQNLILTTDIGEQYIVKIANSSESKLELDMQNSAMAHLTAKGIKVPHAVANAEQQLLTPVANENDHEHQQTLLLRVLSYLPGVFYADASNASHGPELWGSLGKFIGEVDQGLADFQHPGSYRYLEWDLAQGLGICQTKKHCLNAEQRDLVDHFLNLYQAQTLPMLAQLPQGIIHNDANDYNVLIDDKTLPKTVTGLIDFGDMVHSQVINELAIASAYALMGQQDPLATLKTLVAAYHQQRALSETELEVLFSLVALRLCTTVCNSTLAHQLQPENDYLLVSVQPAWALLKQLRQLNPFAVYCQLKQVCHYPVDSGKSKAEITSYRQQHLGKTLSLSYQQPLKIVRGQGAYLYDEQGNGYLDMVNNVCHVGHCHPKVVAAGQAQLAKLNTNTRYLHDNLVNYADKLLATMPDELSVCMLVNSGSEANELAFRLARNYSKSKELLVVDGAYHGNTNACIEASPYKFDGPGGEGAQPYVHKVTLPDPYRGEFLGDTLETANAYADSIDTVISELAAQGKKPGAYICESLQGVAGQIIMPQGYLNAVYSKVRAAGGVCIADEVQVGFGRVGTHMWAFETQHVTPDIVTLGKPIGNGHPMAAVITTQAIADAFVTGMEYFNTFGGNPVSCAIGTAVLDVIKEEKLQQHALTTGNYFQQQLKQLQQQFDLIGEVRGLGLFIGVELVEDRDTKQPATDKTSWLIEYFKQNNILLSTEGPCYNILKIKPPLAFSQHDADKFIAVLKAGLTELL